MNGDESGNWSGDADEPVQPCEGEADIEVVCDFEEEDADLEFQAEPELEEDPDLEFECTPDEEEAGLDLDCTADSDEAVRGGAGGPDAAVDDSTANSEDEETAGDA